METQENVFRSGLRMVFGGTILSRILGVVEDLLNQVVSTVEPDNIAILITMVVLPFVAIAAVAGLIIYLMGYAKVRTLNADLSKALAAMILSVVFILLVLPFFARFGNVAALFGGLLAAAAEFAVNYFFLRGIGKYLEGAGRPEFPTLARRTWNCYLAIWVVRILMELAGRLPALETGGAAAVLDAADTALSVVRDVVYLVFLYRAIQAAGKETNGFAMEK